ncbi:MAG TPA: Wzz/FepE/Etk N-terminal domain-containing protein, partial [Terracidiphilus sp.]|nr:Wzz/FepE/Etk N-terminal domain-containing protein [Terracidiphilus sp.]
MEPVFQSNTPALREMPPGSMQLTRNLAGIHPAASNQDSILRDYLRVLIKRIWVVLGTLAIIFGATLIASLRATPIYDAVGSIAINKPDPILANIQNGNNNVDYSDPTTDLDTEVRILKS